MGSKPARTTRCSKGRTTSFTLLSNGYSQETDSRVIWRNLKFSSEKKERKLKYIANAPISNYFSPCTPTSEDIWSGNSVYFWFGFQDKCGCMQSFPKKETHNLSHIWNNWGMNIIRNNVLQSQQTNFPRNVLNVQKRKLGT